MTIGLFALILGTSVFAAIIAFIAYIFLRRKKPADDERDGTELARTVVFAPPSYWGRGE